MSWVRPSVVPVPVAVTVAWTSESLQRLEILPVYVAFNAKDLEVEEVAAVGGVVFVAAGLVVV